ncbi:MAG: hypothetical protein KAR38_11690 [Calditrichia bacterium]|nr:hypothetical protein [Calditrichia bacterium]
MEKVAFKIECLAQLFVHRLNKKKKKKMKKINNNKKFMWEKYGVPMDSRGKLGP